MSDKDVIVIEIVKKDFTNPNEKPLIQISCNKVEVVDFLRALKEAKEQVEKLLNSKN